LHRWRHDQNHHSVLNTISAVVVPPWRSSGGLKPLKRHAATSFFYRFAVVLGFKKTYEFAGTVYDATTGKPLAGADCGLTMIHETSRGGELVPGSKVRTDSTGTFYLFGESKKADSGYLQVYKFGFITYKRWFEGGGTLNDDIYMYKMDSYLEMSFTNTSTTETRRAYYGLNYDPLGSVLTCNAGACAPTVGPGQTKKVVDVVPGGLDVNIYWLDRWFDDAGTIDKDVNITKVFCTRGDTTRITIPF